MNYSLRFSSNRHSNRVIVRAIACGMLMILPSCQMPELREAEPAPSLPAGYDAATNSGTTQPAAFKEGTTSENSAQTGIDAFFGDPTLTRLIHQALADNRELKILNEEVRMTRNDIRARRGAYLPFMGIGAGVGVEKPSLFTPAGAVEEQLEVMPGKPFPDPLPNFLAAVDLTWQLDIWRQLRNARDAAVQRYHAAAEKRNFFVTRLVAEVAENYYRLMSLDMRLDTLNKTIAIQQQSLKTAQANRDAGRGTELPVQRFQAEVQKNQSEKLVVNQDIIEIENRINFLLNRYPVPVERATAGFLDLNIHKLSVGLPSQLLQNRPDIRQAERELTAAGLDVKVARANFYPSLTINGGLGYEAYKAKYLFHSPDALIASVAGNLVAPLLNKTAIQAEYMNANARQMQSIYNYQRVILNAFTEVVNRMSMVENYGKSIEIKKTQLKSLESSVDIATKLFNNARAEYIDVLFSQRDYMDARLVLIDTKKEQLSAIVNAYQALGGGDLLAHSDSNPGEFSIIEDIKLLAAPPSCTEPVDPQFNGGTNALPTPLADPMMVTPAPNLAPATGILPPSVSVLPVSKLTMPIPSTPAAPNALLPAPTPAASPPARAEPFVPNLNVAVPEPKPAVAPSTPTLPPK